MNEQIEKLLKEVEELKELMKIDFMVDKDIYEFGDPYEDEEDGCAGNCCGCSGCEDTEK